MSKFSYPDNDLVICKDSANYQVYPNHANNINSKLRLQ